jgi:hypothetical protein
LRLCVNRFSRKGAKRKLKAQRVEPFSNPQSHGCGFA